MQHIFKSDNNDYPTVFRRALIEILREGKEVKPRGFITKEISPATLVVDPRKTLYLSKLRNLNFAFLFAENLWYLSGRSDTHFLSHYNSRIKTFSEGGLHDGAYGPKIVGQIRHVIHALEKDPDSRQAIISIWRENPRPSKDVPCTSLFQFMIRDGKLNMYVTMRSNDIIWGSNYDVPSFALLQLIIASTLSIEPGLMFHTANSLHLYDSHFDLAEKLASPFEEELIAELPICMPMSLEDHTQNWDSLSVVEGSMRKLGQEPLELIEYIRNCLDDFYQNYAFVMLWFNMLKKKDVTMMGVAVQELEKIGSPLAEWYRIKTEEFKKK